MYRRLILDLILSAALQAIGSENGNKTRDSARCVPLVTKHKTSGPKKMSDSRGLTVSSVELVPCHSPTDRLDNDLAGSFCFYPPRQHSSMADHVRG